MLEFIKIHQSYLVYNTHFQTPCVKDYYDYICYLFFRILEENPKLHVILVFENVARYILSDLLHIHDSTARILYVYFNIEHTLVRIGGRDTEGSPVGRIPVVGMGEELGKNYLIRIDKLPFFMQKDIVIDYSIPNIVNTAETPLAPKLVLVSPLLYVPAAAATAAATRGRDVPTAPTRDINILTTFINVREPRRRALLDAAAGVITNIADCFQRDALENLYRKTRVMINIHQTDHHHTLEELRVLPALCCGVVVICERSPLWERVPYHEFIVWADYGDILQKTQEVLQNYDEYYSKLAGFTELYKKMEKENIGGLLKKIEGAAA
jgi:hypothetical protein